MKTTLITRMGSFVLGGGTGVAAALAGLALWTGTTDLQTIKDSVQSYVIESEQHANALLGEYNVTVDNANAEIGEYQVALEQANSNISQLITAYEDKVTELENANKQAEQDLADLEQALADMETRLDSQYETDMNAVVEKANEQINQANQDVKDTKAQVDEIIERSLAGDIVERGERHQLDTTGDKTVTDISNIVPSEQPQE